MLEGSVIFLKSADFQKSFCFTKQIKHKYAQEFPVFRKYVDKRNKKKEVKLPATQITVLNTSHIYPVTSASSTSLLHCAWLNMKLVNQFYRSHI